MYFFRRIALCQCSMHINLSLCLQATDPHADPHDGEAECGHFKSAGDPHPLCDICAKVSTGRFCTTSDTCDLCKDLDKTVWRRITDTRRRRDNRMRNQNLTYGELTATPIADPSDSGFQGDPPFLETGIVDGPCGCGSCRGPILISGSPAGQRTILGRVLTSFSCVTRVHSGRHGRGGARKR